MALETVTMPLAALLPFTVPLPVSGWVLLISNDSISETSKVAR
jgi:hypothetical protein